MLAVLPVALSACVIVFPTTDGFHHELPRPGTVVIVLGRHPMSVTTSQWLQKRGLVIVERARLEEVFKEQGLVLTYTPDREGDLLRVGQLVGAEQLVFTDHAGYSSASIRAVDVQTGKVLWSGSAYWPDEVMGSPQEKLIRLTCQALATAWGFRPTGNRWISSDSMCQP